MHTKTPAHEGHREFIANLIGGLGLDYIDRPMDSMPHQRMWDRGFEVDMDSMNPKNENAGIPAQNEPGIVVFTDGSKDTKTGKTGAAIVFHKNNRPYKK